MINLPRIPSPGFARSLPTISSRCDSAWSTTPHSGAETVGQIESRRGQVLETGTVRLGDSKQFADRQEWNRQCESLIQINRSRTHPEYIEPLGNDLLDPRIKTT
ncbi:hypothetical protein [Nocardia pseudovaccinii]|uniref:hypothetical protein n=1 Tax=Nocardia pseudovaccinii TaxID=189540 RepID=UPI001C3FE13C|nr:hypothetical protein [Nocardia pseudovaccinii]